MCGHLLRLGTLEQPPLEFGVGDVVQQRPRKAGPLEPDQVAPDGIPGNPADCRDLPLAPALVVQPDDFFDLAHG
ncbi:MAG: hypothetical protein OXI83_06925 [Gemmatimonadota bacterium]|nr:hypothetical protein [Gemmatimonadota bacterium]MYH91126.1 hypothetical protein [Gammaproteobacteria bacterium]